MGPRAIVSNIIEYRQGDWVPDGILLLLGSVIGCNRFLPRQLLLHCSTIGTPHRNIPVGVRRDDEGKGRNDEGKGRNDEGKGRNDRSGTMGDWAGSGVTMRHQILRSNFLR